MLLDLIDLARLRRALIYLLLLLVLYFVQDLLLARVALWGVHALFIPAAVVCVGLFEGGVWGALFGLAAGYFTDMGLPDSVVTFTLLFPVFGFFTGVFGKYVLRKALITALVLSAAAFTLTAAVQAFPFFFTGTRIFPIIKTAVLQVLWSLPFVFAIYYPCRSIAGRDLRESNSQL